MGTDHARFWAKTNPDEGAGVRFKPVAHHLADVAAVARRFLERNPARLKREAALSGLEPEAHARFCAFAAALHDLGKISRVFQAGVEELWPEAALGPYPERLPQSLRHWQASAILFQAEAVQAALSNVFAGRDVKPSFWAAIAGHHGLAPASTYLDADEYTAEDHAEIGPVCVAVAAELCAFLADAIKPPRLEHGFVHEAALSFSLNGLITLSDWVGSDTEFFAFEDPQMPLADYWPLALARADEALEHKRLLPGAPVAMPSLMALSANAAQPRPMQTAAEGLEIGAGQQIILIEDGTGSGKTEAALLLGARMMKAGLGEGIYVALPTMATANAMHGRLGPAIGGLFAEEEDKATLVLAHGKAKLAAALDRLKGEAGGDERDDGTVSDRLNQWIADSGKKAFFADAGAGTIDQAFLSILQKKHLTLRQYALAGRILIVDEAHACDAYMGVELNILAQQQARLGGSMIVLSATLTRETRAALVASFAEGCGLRDGVGKAPKPLMELTQAVAGEAYPLLTRYAPQDGMMEQPVDTDPSLRRSLAVRRAASREETVALAAETARKGACVAIICNAVDSAVNVHDALLAAGHDASKLTLFHARFALGGRMAVEERVLGLFGRDSSPADRAGQILVATQVVEQSLDLDFDLMITDLAPVDLIVQRAGRLWRHRREGRPLAAPVLHILSADPKTAAKPDWLDATLGAAAHVYKLPGVVWRSARDLFAKADLETPDDLRALMARAYKAGNDEHSEDDLPEGLRAAHRLSIGKDGGDRQIARGNVINPREGYDKLGKLSPDETIGTRLGDETVALRLARREHGSLAPLCREPGADAALDWALSEMSVRKKWLERGQGKTPAAANAAEIEAVRNAWPEWEKEMLLFEVLPDGALATNPPGLLRYTDAAGLQRMEPQAG